jgi:hypothetical protein
MMEHLYSLKERLLRKKIVPIKAHMTLADYKELCSDFGGEVEYIYGMEIHLNSKTYVE